MSDQIFNEYQKICDDFTVNGGCRTICPLAKDCEIKPGDDFDAFNKRMNAAAIKINEAEND